MSALRRAREETQDIVPSSHRLSRTLLKKISRAVKVEQIRADHLDLKTRRERALKLAQAIFEASLRRAICESLEAAD